MCAADLSFQMPDTLRLECHKDTCGNGFDLLFDFRQDASTKKKLLKGRARHLHKAEAPHFAKCDPAAFFLLSQQQNVALTRAYTQRKKASLQYTHIFVKIEHSFAPKNYVHLGQ